MRATLKFDGGSRGNPGPSAYGFVLCPEEMAPIRVGAVIPDTTNNVAEYSGLIAGVSRAFDEGVEHLDIFGDSKLVICQINGAWVCKKPHLKILLNDVMTMLAWCSWTAQHVPRAMNTEADALANAAMDANRPFTVRSPVHAR